jgi:3-phenylpropionate/trans-cinnamate dioxygenase ferredoxin reductase subunit
MNERFVIVGASLTGGTAAATLRREGFDGQLTLIGSEGHPPYERPPLSKSFLRGETPFADALVRGAEFYAESEIDLRLDTTVTSLDPGSRTILTTEGERIPYDRLLVATGARNRRLPLAGFDLEGVLGLRTVEDARQIQDQIGPGRRAVVAGMGFIGSEVAASLRKRGVEVAAVDSGTVPLERVLGREVGGVMAGIHREHGVEIAAQDRVEAFEGAGRVECVRTSRGRSIECDFAVVGMGVEPATELVRDSGVEVDNGILVDELCRTNVEGVFAAGDVANHRHRVFGRRIRIEHWQNARRQGRAAALSMMGKGEPYDEIHWFWSDQYEHNLQYAGFHTDWDELAIRGSLEERNFLAFYVKDGRVQATVGMNRGTEVRHSMPLIRADLAVDLAKLADEDLALESLAG